MPTPCRTKLRENRSGENGPPSIVNNFSPVSVSLLLHLSLFWGDQPHSSWVGIPLLWESVKKATQVIVTVVVRRPVRLDDKVGQKDEP